MTRVLATVLFLSAFVAQLKATPPAYGSIYQISDAELDKAVAAGRTYLSHSVPAWHIFRVWIDWSEQVRVYYRSADGPARHLIVKKTKKGWNVTAAPKEIDTELEDVIVTP